MTSQIDFLYGKVHITYNDIPLLNYNGPLPLYGPNISLSFTRMFLTGFFYLGLTTGMYSIYQFLRTASRGILKYIRSKYNAKKYLSC